ncbi:MAG: DUF1194 domain-containing protein [Rhodospirillaceae bacterium]|nr:DUF1194 domain-containing protein [Rhodospirillaceae bacterium]MDD9927106.1 DUF1194 domain-containing protein [Rhodospirillaceae bacterium]
MLRALVIFALFGFSLPATAQERVDLELVFLQDASRSIDDVEIKLQREGYAAAITHPDVLDTILGGYYRRIVVTYVEWGDETSQEIVVPWTIIDGPKAAASFAQKLRTAPRLASGPNAIGSAIAKGHDLIEGNAYKGTRKVIDFPGDSSYSGGGIYVHEARAAALADGIIINGLAILCRDCSGRPADIDLELAFETMIIGGPGSFVVTADGNTSFSKAVLRKLLLEVAAAPTERTARVVPAD